MFRQLRNRFLVVNLVTISLTMLLAFAAIYFITYQDVTRDIAQDRRQIVDSYQKFTGDRMNDGLEPPSGNLEDPVDLTDSANIPDEAMSAADPAGTGPVGPSGTAAAGTDAARSGSGAGSAGSDETGSAGSEETGGANGGPADSAPNVAGVIAGNALSADAASGKPHSSGRGAGRGLGGPPPERSVSFMLLTDNDWTVTSKESRVSIDDTLYEDALKQAVALDRTTGEFTLDGSRWTFEIEPTPQGHMLVFLDITDRRDILTEMIYTFTVVAVAMLVILFFVSRYFANRSIRPVREAFDKQKQFIADASHELKTPLAVINTNADVLLANSEERIASQAKWLHYIKSETERMSRLTSDLLYLTQMDDSRVGQVHVPFDMSEATMDVLLTMEAVIFEQNVLLDYDIAPGIIVNGNREAIKQVVMILLDNAVKYSGPGGTARLTLKKQQGETLLAVSNTGEGIPPEHIGRIFDRFYRTDASRSRAAGGHGLGLAIAKSIVEQQHKGRISAKSVPGELTTFAVHLP